MIYGHAFVFLVDGKNYNFWMFPFISKTLLHNIVDDSLLTESHKLVNVLPLRSSLDWLGARLHDVSGSVQLAKEK